MAQTERIYDNRYNDTERCDFIDRLAALAEEGAAVRELGCSGADVA